MTAPNTLPMGTYADVTGVVDGTGASEIAALIVILKGYIPDVDTIDPAPQGEAPFYDEIPAHICRALRAEIDALAAAIAAAPTS